MTTMRPIRETIPLEEAKALAARRGGRQSIAPSASSLSDADGSSARRDGRLGGRRSAVRSRGDGRLRGHRRGHVRRGRDDAEGAALRSRRVYTGAAAARRIAQGECVEIATGAPLPDGADAVVMVEETEKTADERPHLHAGLSRASTSAAAAADIAAGQAVVAAGAVLNAGRIGALAAIGATTVDVFAQAPAWRSCRPATRSSNPGSRSVPGQIYDINRFTLSSIVRAHGGNGDHHGDRARIRSHDLAASDSTQPRRRTHHLFRRQLGRRTRSDAWMRLQQTGDVIFHGIAVKPGKPTILGRVGGNTGARACPATRRRASRTPICSSIADAATDGATASIRAAHDATAACRAGSCRRPAAISSTRFASADGVGGAGVQRIGRHHQHGARRRLHRNPRADRHRRSRRDGRSEVVLMAEPIVAAVSAPLFELPNQKGEMRSMAEYLQGGPVLLAFHRGTW